MPHLVSAINAWFRSISLAPVSLPPFLLFLHVTSSSAIDSPLWLSVTPSPFHSGSKPIFHKFFLLYTLPSVLWHCWLGGHPACKKTEWWGAGMVICLERDADLHMALLMPLPLTVSCFSKIQIGFTFLVPAHSASPGQRAVKRVCPSYHTLFFTQDSLD